MEPKIVGHLRRLIAGTQSEDEGLEQEQRILEVVQPLESSAAEGCRVYTFRHWVELHGRQVR